MARRMASTNPHRQKTSNGIRTAWISGISSRLAGRKMPTGNELAEAIAEIRDAATDHKGRLRTDLLGQQAGLHKGLALGRPDHPRSPHDVMVAELLVAAGADLEVMTAWVPIGIRRSKPVAAPLSGRRSV